MEIGKIIGFLFIIGLLSIIYSHIFVWLIDSWTYDLYYSHGFLVPLISAYIIWRKRKELRRIEKKPSMLGIMVLIMGLFLHGMGIFWSIDFASAISLIIVIVGLVLYTGGKEIFKALAFPICFLIFMVPMPLLVFENEMQVISASIVTQLLNAIGIKAANTGAEIYLEKSAFLVGAPCSGLRSLISLLTLSTLYAYALEGTNRMRGALLIASLPIAIISNIFRVTAILLIANSYGTEAALNFFHNFSGIVFFIIAIILLLAVGRCFGRLKFKKIF
jgi:exosortase